MPVTGIVNCLQVRRGLLRCQPAREKVYPGYSGGYRTFQYCKGSFSNLIG